MAWFRIGVVLALAACGDNLVVEDDVPRCTGWQQWGNNAAHAGAGCVSAQPLEAKLAELDYDPFVDEDLVGGSLQVHYQVPLLDGDALFMMIKRGTYSPCNFGSAEPCTQIWAEQRYDIADDGTLALRWSFDSDWKPAPQVFEPMFQPALSGARVVVPGAGGALWWLDAASGDVLGHVQPFGDTVDLDLYVASGITVAPDGGVYYNAIKLDPQDPVNVPAQAWLVAVSADGSVRTANYATLVPGAPQPADLCVGTYDRETTSLPWPPLRPDGAPVEPPSSACGPQLPGFNATPAIGPDGTIFVATAAQRHTRYAYVVAVDDSLVPRWATSLRGLVRGGCGITTPSDGTETENTDHCRVGTPDGVERTTGLPPAGQVDGNSSSSPVALPDGGVLYGASGGGNGGRGYLFKLDARGAFVGNYDFGWDSTPAVIGGARDYRIVIKDNHYADDGPFFITQLDASLRVMWRFQNTTTRSCTRQPDGTIECVEDHPNGFEWCVNAVAIDRDGTVLANAEDGMAYAINPDGTLRDSMFLDGALGAAYTPIALDRRGRVFALNRGRLTVIGRR